ncbi:hypothetical protein LOTGIDRAFT_230106 [Lottia gigantea]|uniref:EF-hand domain-containing protein n=1 Tax=Lottia gigantea TaxID=225164 RepID=V4B0Q3_LOTGI|nr:hypothetical protein LOTGIDRAFT_230106 [Lottia gigantea]ESP03778.1 hypothetical protein LOTGIDRAFT_230106 [Lottia gigantea]
MTVYKLEEFSTNHPKFEDFKFRMKIAVVFAVAIVMLLSQESECIVGGLLGSGGAGGLLGGATGLLGGASGGVNLLATITAAVTNGGMTRAALQALLNIDLDLFNTLFAQIDLNVNGMVDLNELLNLQVLLAGMVILSEHPL